jgi:DNA-binding transcriptional ArsR family regulator
MLVELDKWERLIGTLAGDAMQSTLDETLVALADPTRRAILQRLSAGDARVTELAQPFAMSLNAVSKHIRMLERARLVRRRRAGREHILSLRPAALDEAAAWINTQRAAWTARLDALDAILQAEDAAASTSHPEQSP